MQTKLQSKLANRKEGGFTIIEVLIVLAIAGLIILIVFLAVPALQRNSRNTQRANDASTIGGAMNECLAAKNGVATACDTTAEVQAISLDLTKLGQLTTVVVTPGLPAVPPNGNVTTANVGFAAKCNATGDAPIAGSARSFAVVYRLEIAANTNGTPRCVEL